MNTQFGAWIAAAITALQITLNSVGMPAQQISNFLADPFNVAYTYQDSQLDQYFDQSKIQILPGNTIIDGKVYDDVWLSESAAEIFRVNAFDWTTAYSIASNTNGTYASGVGTWDGIPVFSNSLSQRYVLGIGSYDIGNTSLVVTNNPSFNPDIYTAYNYTFSFSDGTSYTGSSFDLKSDNRPFVLQVRTGNVWLGFNKNGSNNWGNAHYYTVPSSLIDRTPFSFDYVSGTIPPDQSLSSDDGLLIHIPHHSGTSHLQNFIEDNPEFAEPGGVVVDPTIDPDINTKLDDLINIIAPLIPVIQASFDVAPVPVPPAPGETIADTDYSVLDTILQSIHNAIQAIPQAISSLGDRILQDIEEGPIKVFDKVLDIFRTLFAPVIALITSGLSIWSYVLSWLNTISAPFNFVLSVLPSGVLIPIYAAIAGFLCIAIFRRFGK